MDPKTTRDAPLGLVDTAELARRLGVSKATIRSWRNRQAPWLPEPVGRLDGFVWREEDVTEIAQSAPRGPGRPSAVGGNELEMARRRSRGVYYTPQDAAHFIASWAVRGAGETFLEPSFGDGSFIKAVADVAGQGEGRPSWIACELDGRVASDAVEAGLVRERELRHGDFLAVESQPVDAVVANPPFVRLRHLPESMRARALNRASELLGEPMHPSGSVWMPFVAHMLTFLKNGGRAALVLPLDFTYVAYARPLWRHLGNNFASLRVLRARQRIFPDINQDVMILLADGYGGSTNTIQYDAFHSITELARGANALSAQISIQDVVSGDRAFQKALLPVGLGGLLREVAPHLQPASERAVFRIGYISGNKSFFHPTSQTAERFSLPTHNLHPAVVNARRLRGLGLRTSGMDETSADHLWVPSGTLADGETQYVNYGAALGVSAGYKARMRSPWYRVPEVRAPDVILSVFSERPLLLINDANWLASNSLLCGYVKGGSAEEFAQGWYSPLTLLSIGLEVHSLGGGVMVMVPNEASRVQMPRLTSPSSTSAALESSILAGDMQGAYASGDAAAAKLVGRRGLELVYEGIENLALWRTR
ncbi:N-6 DNA methylase [Clavibacter michiganensis]|uniref:N-6 DNA methylase n=1 Tax=Clavibacter michiganensis TaxID=28447 RepID=UPI0026DB5202|nr:N-6 DNA methylase [Clavibacter michiganensis]MDO4026921.1 N-6 DNA methylase [Clavibacter michiganensis]MDO4036241.1 N-6 DNA methylase [Clavibacter michiganensis]MDO4048413.1 N-6 DNA methylase [Clavibacter michiganensis]MDO4106881.1 N-6 DNA methylase [Clavibacter michiganensis]MDO4131887.1 N-6 DNA methylase [Clavibacter michiganensis]